ncbi:MAG: serine/threonine protein kinase [Myxococcales bacterium FL481]|nr:MAG: serine/threonine protein kinase [Myxococcales bacterium FL481]
MLYLPGVGSSADTAAEKRRGDADPPASPELRTVRKASSGRVERPSAWAVGHWIADRYFLERRLGGGTTGEVYLARDRLLRKCVALKVLKRPLAESRDTVRRFLREVALAHSVTHPNVVRIYDTGEAQGMPFFSMEYLQGQPLDQLCAQTESPMTVREIREVGRDILRGLSAAHAAGIIHRDLKPANVILTHRGAIVMDFGVAVPDHGRPAAPQPDDATSIVRTEAGTIFGSPAYMAPELWEGSPSTVQSDLYAFGVMLYQMLAGRLPYMANNARQLLYRVRTTVPPPLRQLRRDTPWNMVWVVRRCMAKQPERRPTSALAVANLLTPLAGLQRRRVWVAAAATVGVAATVVAAATRADPTDPRGLPDPVAITDLNAAIRSFDVGEYSAATRQMDRLRARWPRSAAAAWWDATIAHRVGDEDRRRAGCRVREWEGSTRWRRWADAACGPTYSLPSDLQGELNRPIDHPEWLPLAVAESLVPRTDAARASWPAIEREGLAVADTLRHDEPRWSESITLPVRWQLARASLHVGHGDLDAARGVLDELAARHPHTPAVIERNAWLDTLAGRFDRASVRARSIHEQDPRPLVRVLLERGQLDRAWDEIQRAQAPYRPSLLEMWCGYAYRFEIEAKPPRCEALPPSLSRTLWDRSGRSDPAQLSPIERSIASRQRALDRGECFGDDTHRPAIRQIRPPFETYATQLEIASALCLHDASARRSDRARRYVDALRRLTPADPWILLLSALADELAGATGRAQATRRKVAAQWADADPQLPLVRRVRERLSPTPAAPSLPTPPAPTP